MFRIDNTTASPTLKTPLQPGAPGYFTNGDPLTGEQPTVVDADWMSAVQEEIAFVIETSGLALSKTDRTQLYQAITRLTRLRLAGPATFYCDPNGNDNAAGTAADPWASITHAYNFIRDRIDMNGNACTIQLNNGTYAGASCVDAAVGPWVTIHGNDADPTQVTVHGINAPSFVVASGAGVYLQSLRVTATGVAGNPYSWNGVGLQLLNCQYGMSNIFFDLCSAYHIAASYCAIGGAQGMNFDYTIIGGAQCHAIAADSASIGYMGALINIYNNPNFSTAFAQAYNGGVVDFRQATFSGGATGPRYNVSSGGAVQTGTGNPNFLPGNAAGVNNGGYYG